MSARKAAAETRHPRTMEEHREVNRIHVARKTTAVSDTLKFPDGDQFEADLNEIFSSDAESSGEIIAIALTDSDKFDHINRDFGVEEGDRILISTGKYIESCLPKGAKIYRIGGDEFAILFRGSMEREEIFLLLNDMKNHYDVKTPDGVPQTAQACSSKKGSTPAAADFRFRDPLPPRLVWPY